MEGESLVAHLRTTLNVEARAVDDAINGVPRSDSTDLTGTESEILAEVRNEGVLNVEGLVAAADEMEQKWEECKTKRQELERDLVATENQEPPRSPGYEHAIRELEQAQAHLNMFKVQHDIHRKPRVPESRFWIFCLMIGVVVVEGMVNSFFFAQASDFGLLGGFIQAFFVSAVNVGFSFIGGFFALRQLSHRNPGRQLLGLIGVFAIMVVVVAINLMTAQYRGILELGVENPERVVMERVRDLDFSGALSSLNSALLALIGFLCAFFSFWKGFGADDPYPGYGAMHRDVEAAQERVEDFSEEIQVWRDEVLDQLSLIKRGFRDLSEAVLGASRQCRDQRQRVDEFTSERLVAIARQLLTIYRDTNRKVRATPSPAYFEHYPEEKEFTIDSRRVRAARRIEKLEEITKNFYAEINEIEKDIERRMSKVRTTK